MSTPLDSFRSAFSSTDRNIEMVSFLDDRIQPFYASWKFYGKMMYDFICNVVEKRFNLPIGEVIGQDLPLTGFFSLLYSGTGEKNDDYYTTSLLLSIVKAYQDTILDMFDQEDDIRRYTAILVIEAPKPSISEDDEPITLIKIRIQFPWCRMTKAYYQKHFIRKLRRTIDHIVQSDFAHIDYDLIRSVSESLDDIRGDILPLLGSQSEFANLDALPSLKVINRFITDQDLDDYNRARAPFDYGSWELVNPCAHRYFTNYGGNYDMITNFKDDKPANFWAPIILSVNYYNCLMTEKRVKVPKHIQENISFDEVLDSDDPKDLLFQISRFLSKDRFMNLDTWLEIGKIAYKTYECQPDRFLSGSAPDNPAFKWWRDGTILTGKFTESDCIREWQRFNSADNRLTVKRVAEYAIEDSPQRFNQWRTHWVRKAFDSVIDDASDERMGRAFYRMFWLKYIFVFGRDGRTNGSKWYEFNGVRLVEIPAVSLHSRITKEFSGLIKEINVEYAQLMNSSNMTETQIRNLTVLQGNINKLLQIIQRNTTKNKIVISAQQFFIVYDFWNFKDLDPYLLGTENSIICFGDKEATSRRGYIEDYITKSTRIPFYPDFPANNENIKKVKTIISQLLVYDEEMIEFFWIFLASILRGKNAEKHLNIFIGDGDNGKSLILKMIKAALGDYSIDFPSELLTCRGKSQSGSATPELAQAESCRLGLITELNNDEKLASGPVKKNTGGDFMAMRGLFESFKSIQQVWKIIIGTNRMPEFTDADKALMDRVLVFLFNARFVEDPPETLEEQIKMRQFPINRDLEDQIPDLAPAMLYLMVQKYKVYRQVKLKNIKPKLIVAYMNDYWRDFDPYLSFIYEVLTLHYADGSISDSCPDLKKRRASEPSLSATQVNQIFNYWWKMRYQGSKNAPPDINRMSQNFNDPHRLGSQTNKKWFGVSIKPEWVSSD